MPSFISRRWFLALAAAAITMRRGAEAEGLPGVPTDLDHILLGVSDLDQGIAWLEDRSGVRAAFGGVHPGRGTRNALLSLGPRRYLEIIAPDPAQTEKASRGANVPLVNNLHKLKEPRLIGWVVHTDDLANLVKKVVAAGFEIDQPRDGSRTRPDGKVLRWKSCSLKQDRCGLLPFFIEWSPDSVHPSQDAPSGCTIQAFAVESWIPDTITQVARKLGIDLVSKSGKRPALRARIAGARRDFELA